MSFFPFFKTRGLLAVTVFAFCISGAAFDAEAKTQAGKVQPVDEAAPLDPLAFPHGPLRAGALTMEDVLEAHRSRTKKSMPAPPAETQTPSATATAPVLAPPSGASTTGLMVSQGMKAVLHKLDPETLQTTTPTLKAPALPTAEEPAQEKPQSLVSGIKYERGREPKTLDSAEASETGSFVSLTTPSKASEKESDRAKESAAPCTPKIEKWEKTCAEAGYPENFAGRIVGETRIGCTDDNALHDFWVSNTCAPPESAAEEKPTSGKEVLHGACGSAHQQIFAAAPTSDLCASGTVAGFKGHGPWTWSCEGDKQGRNEVCAAFAAAKEPEAPPAPKRAPKAAASSDAIVMSPELVRELTGGVTVADEGAIASTTEPGPEAASQAVSAPVKEKPEPEKTNRQAEPVMEQLPGDNEDLCGLAAETLATEAPAKNLCRAGTASAVNGDGPWTWSCTNNEGVVSSCRTLTLRSPSRASSSASGSMVNAAPREKVEASVKAPHPAKEPAAKAQKTQKPTGAKPEPSAETLNRQEEPVPSPDSFKKAPIPSRVPPEAVLESDPAPVDVPDVKEEEALQPPPMKEAAKAPETEKPQASAKASGPRLALDPTLSSISFAKGSDVIGADALPVLAKLAATLKQNRDVRISLISHADSEGSSPRQAHRLSLNRALNVRGYLSSHGIEESRVDISAKGSEALEGTKDSVDVEVYE